ncbi:MAG: hypothetical protein WC899_02220 [bacterium]|jgi:hypothetical protein
MKSPQFIIALNEGEFFDQAIEVDWLKRRSLLKTMSLILAHRAGVTTPATVLLCSHNTGILEEAGERWRWPLMVRMDFVKLPRPKFLGGIPVFSIESAIQVSKFLFAHKCFPLFHPHLDRFRNEYSVGILFDPSNLSVVHAEIVGQGFDAGDLRLGVAVPHEVVRLDLDTKTAISLNRIDPGSYARECTERRIRVEALRRYVTFVNARGRLVSNLEDPEIQKYTPDKKEPTIPIEYTSLPEGRWRELAEIATILQHDVLPILPSSRSFAASLSFIPGEGWLLWDIYGSWYKR